MLACPQLLVQCPNPTYSNSKTFNVQSKTLLQNTPIFKRSSNSQNWYRHYTLKKFWRLRKGNYENPLLLSRNTQIRIKIVKRTPFFFFDTRKNEPGRYAFIFLELWMIFQILKEISEIKSHIYACLFVSTS